LLIAAVVAIVCGVILLKGTDEGASVADALIVLGAVCIGAWIALLAAHGYGGHE
jgi:hypothetical protein